MTQEYTPTTEEVRSHYAARLVTLEVDDNDLPTSYVGRRLDQVYGAEFDRWLAAHDAQIRAEASSEALELVTSRELDVGVNAAYKDDLLAPASSALQKAMRAIAQYRKEQQ